MRNTHSPDINYAIGLILYHPEKSLLQRVDLMINLGFSLYIFDNSPYDETDKTILKQTGKISYMTAGKNVGLGHPLSILCATAYADGHQRLLFLDQDTGISEKTLKYINKYPMTLTAEQQEKYAALVFSGKEHAQRTIVDTAFAISSGSLFTLTTLKKIGWHNEKYFVDCVDYEFCMRAKRCGYKIGIAYNTPDFDHVSEQPDRSISIFGKKLLVRRYPASRIKDALKAYLRLLISSARTIRVGEITIITKSLLIYLAGQVLSRIVLVKTK